MPTLLNHRSQKVIEKDKLDPIKYQAILQVQQNKLLDV